MEDNTEYTGERTAQFTWEGACVKRIGRGLRISATPKVIKRVSCMLTMLYDLESSC